jgi:hypothetical protein
VGGAESSRIEIAMAMTGERAKLQPVRVVFGKKEPDRAEW